MVMMKLKDLLIHNIAQSEDVNEALENYADENRAPNDP